MQNEQCGICWNLKFDKQGEKTHTDQNNFHNFVSLDYCIKCREPEYDQFGLATHQDKKYDFIQSPTSSISHEFISGIETKSVEKKRKKRSVFSWIGIVSFGIGLTVSLSNLFF